MKISPHIENFLKDLGSGANFLGHEIYIVGGAVRNHLYEELHNHNSKKPQDLDLVINTNAITFAKQFQKYYEDNNDDHISFDILEEFEQFGTVKINHPEDSNCLIEIASTRSEIYKEPAAFPTITLVNSIETDLPRRDFSINALLMSLNKVDYGEIIDHVGGINDMQNKLVRVFHDYSFIDDPTRIYRAVRMMLEYDFQIEVHTLELLKAALKHPDFDSWYKKRKNRFAIEKNNIIKLGQDKERQAKDFFTYFHHNY